MFIIILSHDIHPVYPVSILSQSFIVFCVLLQLKDDKLDSARAVTVVEMLITMLTERKTIITDYYEHWKGHVNSGREFKTQWHQFIKDARKV